MEVKSSLLILMTFLVGQVNAKGLVGRVIDSETSQPIENVTVIIMGTTIGTFTNSAGYFEIEGKKGTRLVLSHVSYQTGQISASSGSGILIKLQPKVVALESLNLNNYSSQEVDSKEIPDQLFAEEKEKPDEAFVIVEANAKYRGGIRNFHQTLASSINKQGRFEIKERIFIFFTVNEYGKIENVRVLPSSPDEKILITNSLIQIEGWKSAIQHGKTTSQTFLLELYADEPEETFVVAEEAASFPGGLKAWGAYLSKEMKYPRQAQRMGIEGRVFVQFVVEKDGSLTNIQVVKGIGAGCDAEAIRVLQAGPNWIPGKQRGLPVRQKMIQNILFRFNNSWSKGSKNSSDPFIIGKSESRAKYNGGVNAYHNFLTKNRTTLRKQVPPPNKFSNNVRVELEVSSKGELSNWRILDGLGEPFDSEALRLVSLMPDWSPALRNGSPISALATIDIPFNKIPFEKSHSAVNLFEKGNNFFKRQNYEKSVILFTKSIQKNPTDLNFYFNRAVSLIELSKLNEACSDLTLIKERDIEAMNLYNQYCK